jgi:hypothetical protein
MIIHAIGSLRSNVRRDYFLASVYSTSVVVGYDEATAGEYTVPSLIGILNELTMLPQSAAAYSLESPQTRGSANDWLGSIGLRQRQDSSFSSSGICSITRRNLLARCLRPNHGKHASDQPPCLILASLTTIKRFVPAAFRCSRKCNRISDFTRRWNLSVWELR